MVYTFGKFYYPTISYFVLADKIKKFLIFSNEEKTAIYVLKVVLNFILRFLGLVWLTGTIIALVSFLIGLLGFAFLVVIPFL